MPDLRKSQREVLRVLRQIAALPEVLFERTLATRLYDLFQRPKIARVAGDLAMSDRVAIYLIYPKFGVKESHLTALRYLSDKSISPLVISNLPLDAAALDLLRPVAAQVLIRPNVGYDFGGYRDGVLDLSDQLSDLSRLYFLNDSTWFPLPGSKDWVDEVDALGADFCGAASNYGIKRYRPEEAKDFRWSYASDHKNFHYCSYALACSAALLRDPGFLDYWRTLPLTASKNRVVRRGEIGLTRWALSNGYSHASTLATEELDQRIADLDDARLRRLADNLIIPDDAALSAWKTRVLQDPSTERADLERLVLLTVARKGVSYTAVDLICGDLGFPFLKKSPLWLNQAASDITLSFLGSRSGGGWASLLDEANELRERSGVFGPPPELQT